MLKTLLPVLGFSALLLGCDAKPRPLDAGGKLSTQMLDTGTNAERDADALRDTGAPQNGRDAGVKADSQAMRDTKPGDRQEVGAADVTSQCDAMRCVRQGDELARSLVNPADTSIACKGGDCARVDVAGLAPGMACTCQTSNGWIYLGPDGGGCFARGRAGDCLWDDSEFKSCTQGDPTCPAMCEELEKRFTADAAKSFDAEVRASTCRDGSCRHVLRIETACYTDRTVSSGRRFDCTLSDSAILDREDQAR